MKTLHLLLTAIRFSAARLLGTAWLEIRLTLGSPTPWIIGAILGAFAYLIVRFSPDPSSFPIAWALSSQYAWLSPVLLLFLAGSQANRPVRYELSEIQDSKLVGSEELLLGRWFGMVATVLVPLAIQYLVAMAAQKIHAKPPVMPAAYLLGFCAQAPAVLFFATAAFCLVSLTRVLILGAGLAGLLWFGLEFGQINMPAAFRFPTVFRPDLSQNAGIVWAATVTILVLALLAYGARRRARRSPMGRVLALLGILLVCATAVRGAWAALALPGRDRALATWRRMRDGRPGKSDPLPNFAWLDQHERRISLASLRGRVVMLVLVRPSDGGLLPLLQRLAALRREYGSRRFETVAVFLSKDLNAGSTAASLARADLPVVTDWGGPSEAAFSVEDPGSPLSWALRVDSTPQCLLVDADGKEIARGLRLDEEGWDDLKQRVEAALKGEAPEPELPAGLPIGEQM